MRKCHHFITNDVNDNHIFSLMGFFIQRLDGFRLKGQVSNVASSKKAKAKYFVDYWPELIGQLLVKANASLGPGNTQ